MDFHSAYIAAQDAKDTLVMYYSKTSFWRRAVYLGLIVTVLFAALAFLIRLSTGNYTLPALLAVSMIPATIFICFSLCKMRTWEDKANRQSLDVYLLDAQLCNIANNQKS